MTHHPTPPPQLTVRRPQMVVAKRQGGDSRGTMQILADALKHGKRHAESLEVLEANFARVTAEDDEHTTQTLYYIRGQIADCLDYLRARVGVPRDMTHTAAQQLRAELKGVSVRLRSAVGMKEKISA